MQLRFRSGASARYNGSFVRSFALIERHSRHHYLPAMPGTCVIGLQWGDEAKGKIVDLLTASTTSSSAIRAARTPATRSSSATRSTSSRCFPAASSRRA